MSSRHHAARRHLLRVDPALGRVIRTVGACTLSPRRQGTHFEALARAICGQQVTGHVANVIFGRVRALSRTGRFPSAPEVLALGNTRLRSAGLSRQKAAALLDLAAHVVDGKVPLGSLGRLEDDAIIDALTSVRGIGTWTVQMLLIFRLGRPDVLPTTDYGVQKGLAVVDGSSTLPRPRDVLARGAAWAPFRSVASWYLWRATELPPMNVRDPAAR